MIKFSYVFVLAVGFVFAAAAVSAEDTVCFSCHEKQAFSGKVVHKPLAGGKCTSCHNPHVAHYRGLLDQQGSDLCYSCHQDEKKSFATGVIHQPVRDGNCLSCHEAHVSKGKGLLKEAKHAICFQCHTDLPQKHKYTHTPFKEGNCSACHRPHQSDFSQLLKDEEDSLCLSCHSLPEIAKKHAKYPEPVANCLSCHNPHGSDRKGLIRNVLHPPYEKGCRECHGQQGDSVTSGSCLRCHEEIGAKMLTLHSHLTIFEGNSCVACHSPHAADAKNLLKGGQYQVCRSCHGATMERYVNTLYKHQEIDTCTECHDVHGSDRLVMLTGDGNTVCTRCHETQGEFTHPVGEKIVDPRTGTSVSCLSCHNPMGTDYKYELIYSGSKDLCVQCHKSY